MCVKEEFFYCVSYLINNNYNYGIMLTCVVVYLHRSFDIPELCGAEITVPNILSVTMSILDKLLLDFVNLASIVVNGMNT